VLTKCRKLWLVQIVMQVPSDEPVWRQVLRLHLGHSDPALAEMAAAALAEIVGSSNRWQHGHGCPSLRPALHKTKEATPGVGWFR
jgi:hypothetical protein